MHALDRRLEAESAPLAFLAEAGRYLAESEDYEEVTQMVATLSLPPRGAWSIVDLVEDDGSLRRLPVVHPNPEHQTLVRQLTAGWPPERDDPLGIPVVVRTRETQVALGVTDDLLSRVARDADHLHLLRRLGITSVITVPLLVKNRVLGAITFVGGAEGGQPGAAALALAEGLAARCALAIHQARRVQELKTSVLLRDQVLGYVSHDLKNPLGAILLIASKILAEAEGRSANPSPEGRNRDAEIILNATLHMQHLIGDLLEVAQIGAGAVSLEQARIDPAVLLPSIRDAYGAGLAAQSLRLEMVVLQGLPVLRADARRLRQVFENLLENAAKFTLEGGTITIAAAPLDGSVLFSVADPGVGIPPEDMPHLFDRFWQARPMGVGSAGLGLAICKGIVEAHGGAIWAESEVGRGSTFYFRIPVTV